MVTIEDTEHHRIRSALNRIAEFTALYETSDEKLKTREKALDQKLLVNEKKIAKQIADIQNFLKDFQEIMTEAGAARWRIAAENSLRVGEEHLQNIRLATQEFVDKTLAICQKIQQMSDQTTKDISKAANSFRVEDFQQFTSNSVQQIRQTCSGTLNRMSIVMRWFHWRNIGMVVAITIFVTMIIGLYINDEWPWESHQRIMQQRNLAKAVIASWSHISHDDQQEILNNASRQI